MLNTREEEGDEAKTGALLHFVATPFNRCIADIRRVSALLIERPLSFGDVFKHITITGGPRTLSFTFSARVVLNSALMAALSSSGVAPLSLPTKVCLPPKKLNGCNISNQ